MEYVYQSVSIVVTRQTFKVKKTLISVSAVSLLKRKVRFFPVRLELGRQACALMLLFILKIVTISD